MTFLRRHLKLLTIGAACAAVGAGASAIATAGAAGTSTTTTSGSAAAHPAAARAAARRTIVRRAVQGSVVVASKSGFGTVTFSRGFVQSVSGQQLTIREGTKAGDVQDRDADRFPPAPRCATTASPRRCRS